jgi:aspartyl aminopeptidase
MAPLRPQATGGAGAQDFVRFVNASPSPYHATAESARRLAAAGFVELKEREAWEGVKPGGRYFVVRNQSAVLAFAVGGRYQPGNGFTIAASHTDSPCLRVKPVSSLTKTGYLSVGVETYGGAPRGRCCRGRACPKARGTSVRCKGRAAAAHHTVCCPTR